VEQVEANTGTPPVRALADAGYRSEANLQELEARGIEGFVPMWTLACFAANLRRLHGKLEWV